MFKNFINCFILCLSLAIASFYANAEQINKTYYSNSKQQIEELKSVVGFLSDSICGGRKTGSLGSVAASFYIASRFRDIGLKTFDNVYSHHFYTAAGPIGRNIIGFLPATNPYSRKYIVVMAHYDAIGDIDTKRYPSSDSNASGVAGLITLAKMLSAYKAENHVLKDNYIFVATDGKLLNMTGAADLYYRFLDGCYTNPITSATIYLKDVSLVVNLDQIGATLSPLKSSNPNYLIMLGQNSLKANQRDFLNLCNKLYNTNLELSYTYYDSPSFSKLFYNSVCEQKVFIEDKIPAVLFTSGISLNNNKTEDNPESLNYKVFRDRIYLIFRWLNLISEY